MEFAGAATTAGRDMTAREAYTQAARLSPSDPAITKALSDLDQRVGRLRGPGER
jgi:cytochrome c-type biogenesis protein CcmH/NrfG